MEHIDAKDKNLYSPCADYMENIDAKDKKCVSSPWSPKQIRVPPETQDIENGFELVIRIALSLEKNPVCMRT
jgi:hypothetical protein